MKPKKILFNVKRIAEIISVYAGMHKEIKHHFIDEAEAYSWLYNKINDPYFDNFRIGYIANKRSMREYRKKRDTGCCGSSDYLVFIGMKVAYIGCNFGH